MKRKASERTIETTTAEKDGLWQWFLFCEGRNGDPATLHMRLDQGHAQIEIERRSGHRRAREWANLSPAQLQVIVGEWAAKLGFRLVRDVPLDEQLRGAKAAIAAARKHGLL